MQLGVDPSCSSVAWTLSGYSNLFSQGLSATIKTQFVPDWCHHIFFKVQNYWVGNIQNDDREAFHFYLEHAPAWFVIQDTKAFERLAEFFVSKPEGLLQSVQTLLQLVHEMIFAIIQPVVYVTVQKRGKNVRMKSVPSYRQECSHQK